MLTAILLVSVAICIFANGPGKSDKGERNFRYSANASAPGQGRVALDAWLEKYYHGPPAHFPGDNVGIGDLFRIVLANAMSAGTDKTGQDSAVKNGAAGQAGLIDEQKNGSIIRDAASRNIPMDLETLGSVKQSFIDKNDLAGYKNLIESLPDSYEMKNELIADLAFSYRQQGQMDEALETINTVSDKDSVRFHYYMSDLYWSAGEPQPAINELVEAGQAGDEPYLYTRISELLQAEGYNTAAAYYREKASTLQSVLYNGE